MQLAINIENGSVAEKILWFLNHCKNDSVSVKIIDDALDIEQINSNDSDYQHFFDAKEARKNGKQSFTLDDVMKEFYTKRS
jgi:hypothetical protein